MAFYSDEIIEEIKSASDIVDVVSKYTSLKRKGNNYFGLCPFHNEKTPSFSVSPEKQIFHCFGCGVGGNVVNFVMKAENIGFKEVIELLAERANIALPTDNYDELGVSQDELIKRDITKKNMYEINKLAGRFFYDNISKSKEAQEYIAKRMISMATVRKFGLGFALNDNGLSKYLLSKGFSENDILETGLANKSQINGELYDRFRNRFMFPIFDIRGRVVAFGGRCLESNEIMKEKKIAKYINSPENLIYTKGRHLYALNVAKKSADKMKRVLVVEGYMDVISPHQAGITNVVASLGTALTEHQGRLLRQYADEVVLSYDSDVAGQKAIERGLEILRSLGVNAKVLQMTGAKDPDEYILKYGAERFNKLIDNSISYAEYKIRKMESDYNLDETDEKIKFLTKIADTLAKVDNNIERDLYVDKFSRELGVGKEAILAEIEKKAILSKKNDNVIMGLGTKPDVNKRIAKNNTQMEDFIIYLLSKKDESIFRQIREFVDLECINDAIHKSIISKIFDYYEKGDYLGKSIDLLFSDESEYRLFAEIIMRESVNEDADKIMQEIKRTFGVTKLNQKKQELIYKLQNASTNEERELIEAQLNNIIGELGKLSIR